MADKDFLALPLLQPTLEKPVGLIVREAHVLARDSIQRWLSEPNPSLAAYLQCTDYRYNWRFYIGKQDERMVFFFFRSKETFEIVLDARVSFRIVPVETAAPYELPEALPVYWSVPPFFEWQPKRWSEGGPKRSPLGSGNIRMDQNLVLTAFSNPPKAESDIMGGQQLLLWDGQKDKYIPENRLNIQHAIQFYDRIRDWVQGKDERRLVPVQVEAIRAEDIKTVLLTFRQQYAQLYNTLRHTSTQSDLPAWAEWLPHYQLGDYRAELLLQLNESGEIAFDLGKLSYQLRACWEPFYYEKRPALRLRLLPPDFLISGDLFEAFLAFLSENKETLRTVLDVSTELLEKILEVAPGRASIFRDQKGLAIKKSNKVADYDTQVFLLPYEENGQRNALLFYSVFEIDTKTSPPTVRLAPQEKFTNLKHNNGKLKRRARRYLHRTIAYLQKWREIVVE